MTPRDRVIRSIKRQPLDYAPFQLDMTEGVRKRLEEYYGLSDFEYTIVGNHLIREKNKRHVYHPDGSYTDLFGVTWDTKNAGGGDIGEAREYLLNEPDLSRFIFHKPDAARILGQCRRMAAAEGWPGQPERLERPERFRIYEIGHTLYERAWMLRGMEDFLADFLLEASFVHELFERLTEYALEIIEIVAEANSAADGGAVDCIMFGDDWGCQNGPIMGRSLWVEFIKPCMQRLLSATKKHNMYTCLHSCGDIHEIFGDLIDIGLDIYNTFQPEIYDKAWFKREYGAHLTIYGGIGAQSVLPFGAPSDVRRAVADLIHTIGDGGGLIVAPTHQITPDVPTENILAFIDAVHNQSDVNK